jgi:hypothetical protein
MLTGICLANLGSTFQPSGPTFDTQSSDYYDYGGMARTRMSNDEI